MRVLHVITGLRTGGAENQLLLLARHTATDPTVVALTNADEVADALRSEGTEVLDLGMRSNKDAAALFRLARVIARHRPDVVHVHLYRATLYGRVAARLAGVPAVVTTEHSLLEGELEGRRTTGAVRRMYLATERFNDVTIAVSDAVAARLVRWGLPPEKVRVIPNAVDLEALHAEPEAGARVRAELGIPTTARLVGGIGRLHPVKRWDLVIRGLAPHLGEDLQLLLVGSGEEEAALRELAASLGVTAWVHLPGARSDVPAVLAAMDVVVSPSPQETFGLSLVEAVGAGRPVVYVSSPGLEVLGPIAGATRVEADPGRLRDAVLETLRNPPNLPMQDGVGRYDVRAVARQVDEVYQQCVQSARRTGRRSVPARNP